MERLPMPDLVRPRSVDDEEEEEDDDDCTDYSSTVGTSAESSLHNTSSAGNNDSNSADGAAYANVSENSNSAFLSRTTEQLTDHFFVGLPAAPSSTTSGVEQPQTSLTTHNNSNNNNNTHKRHAPTTPPPTATLIDLTGLPSPAKRPRISDSPTTTTSNNNHHTPHIQKHMPQQALHSYHHAPSPTQSPSSSLTTATPPGSVPIHQSPQLYHPPSPLHPPSVQPQFPTTQQPHAQQHSQPLSQPHTQQLPQHTPQPQAKPRVFSGAEIEANDVKLLRLRGQGCFGKVWEGEVYNKTVAIKVPLIQNLDRNQLRSLRTEILIMSNNPHPNIILFMGACTQPGRLQIVTELLDGDLEALLHDKRVHLSLFERLCMAKDAALGMTWLHSVRPAIIHRDLKTANLLFKRAGTSYTIKVCDFGLSAIKPPHSKQLRDGQDGAKGTPLYMAPEVMSSKDFNEKADVYSFGICLWEIYTRQDPFSHHSDYDEFLKAVCRIHERPPIPENCPTELKALMEDCWHPLPESRPDFTQVCDRLDNVIVDAAILDTHGRQFWKTFFLKNHSVPWESFVRTFYGWLNIALPPVYSVETAGSAADPPTQPPPHALMPVTDEDIFYCVLRTLVESERKRPAGEQLEVNIEWFGNLLNWFGPVGLNSRDGFTILNRMRFLCSHEWFHGNIDAHEAEIKLAQKPAGTYLVRFSTNTDYPGAFTITRVTFTGGPTNVRIKQLPNYGGFTITGNGDHNVFNSMVQLLSAVQVPLGLGQVCGGESWPFLHLFSGERNQQPGGGYEAVDLGT
eukprot:TRINITY_DN1555_c0_g1_i2.p1 TRINITY_DN1555_c0_g1~~TRINITY_DN1555_c0_g1_i2.p1  ORF type:complete len:791 (-),score=155.72 TRINITY_DN1555_c0_g1_i2:21-2393(-)